jgi:hypothetical protein
MKTKYLTQDKDYTPGKPFDWIIPLVMPNIRLSANGLARSGIPVSVVGRWSRERRDATRGLKRRVKENVN